jgi:hypothetical protein
MLPFALRLAAEALSLSAFISMVAVWAVLFMEKL